MTRDELLGSLYSLRAGLSVIAIQKDNMERERKASDDIYEVIKKSPDTSLGMLRDNKYGPFLDGPYLKAVRKEFDRAPVSQKYVDHCISLWFECDFKSLREFWQMLIDNSEAADTSWVENEAAWADKNSLTYEIGKKLQALFWGRNSGQSYPTLNSMVAKNKSYEAAGAEWLQTDEARSHYKKKLETLRGIRGVIQTKYNALPKDIGFFTSSQIKTRVARHYVLLAMLNEVIGRIEGFDKKNEQDAKTRKTRWSNFSAIKVAAKDLSRGITDTFSRIIDRRDWQHLDLVIYFLETGRADTMKEALFLVDREIQNNRMLQAISMATERVCSTIERGFSSLKSAVQTGFSNLQKQISMEFAAQNTLLNTLVDSTNLNNALVKKLNVSSDKLVKDLDYIAKVV